ncbi:MAG: LytTR family DNA-binding domain-containing protein [Chitinophagales bacterium]|nr:LytTR family DNA-binding domain-containing protein [Chitinophagales bacterium]
MNKLKAILVDDFEHARLTLKKDLQVYAPQVEVIGEAGGVIEAAKLLKKKRPDVLFLDIQMQDGNGFDLLDVLEEINFKIIFITASDAYAIKAFKYAAIDYLLKPVDPDELVSAINKLKITPENEQAKYDLFKKQLQPKAVHNKLALNTMDRIFIVNIADIIRCESEVNYTIFHFKDKPKLIVTKTLKEYEDILKDHGFFRVHQSHLVNTACIKAFIKTEDVLVLQDETQVPVSSRKRTEVLKMIEAL